MAQLWLDHPMRTQVTPDQMAADHLTSIMYGAKNIRGPFFYPQSPYGQPIAGLGRLGAGGVYSGTITLTVQGRNWTATITGGPPNRGVALAMAIPNMGQVSPPFTGFGTLDSNGNLTSGGSLGNASGTVGWTFQLGVHPMASFSANVDSGSYSGTQAFTVDTTGDYGAVAIPAESMYQGNTPGSQVPGYMTSIPAGTPVSTQSAPRAQPGTQPGVTPISAGFTPASQTVAQSQAPPNPPPTGNATSTSSNWGVWALAGAAVLAVFMMGGKH